MNGFRKCLVDEFDHIYVFNLRGNQRTSGELSRREGGKIFGSGSRAPISITVLVKLGAGKRNGVVHYHDIGDYLTREEKLKKIVDFHDISHIPWVTLNPDAHGDWINQRNSEFDAFIPLAPEKKGDASSQSFFTTYAIGLSTNRDAWTTNHSKSMVVESMRKTIDFYNQCVDKTKELTDKKFITWTRSLRGRLARKEKSLYRKDALIELSYRPFQKQWVYFDRTWNEAFGLSVLLFPTSKQKNLAICISGDNAVMTASVADLHFVGDVQAFPLYWYEKIEKKAQMTFSFEEGKDDEYVRHDGVSDFILKQFQHAIGPKVNKEDIFYFVYAALHHRGYREKFAADLKKQLPRLPVPVSMDDYKLMVKVGHELAALHLHYEDIEGYGLREVKTATKVNYEVKKLYWGKKGKEEDRSKIIVNETLTLEGIPAKAHEYVVNGRTGLEWIIERYQVKTDKDSGITNDPNDWGKEHNNPRYIVDLIQSVTAVSVKTVDLIKKLDDVQLRQ